MLSRYASMKTYENPPWFLCTVSSSSNSGHQPLGTESPKEAAVRKSRKRTSPRKRHRHLLSRSDGSDLHTEVFRHFRLRPDSGPGATAQLRKSGKSEPGWWDGRRGHLSCGKTNVERWSVWRLRVLWFHRLSLVASYFPLMKSFPRYCTTCSNCPLHARNLPLSLRRFSPLLFNATLPTVSARATAAATATAELVYSRRTRTYVYLYITLHT